MNPLFDTLDEFIKGLIADGFIPEDILRQCRLAANLLDTGELHMVLENIERLGDVCRNFMEEIAEKINNPGDDESTVTTAIPQVRSATVEPPIEDPPRGTTSQQRMQFWTPFP